MNQSQLYLIPCIVVFVLLIKFNGKGKIGKIKICFYLFIRLFIKNYTTKFYSINFNKLLRRMKYMSYYTIVKENKQQIPFNIFIYKK